MTRPKSKSAARDLRGSDGEMHGFPPRWMVVVAGVLVCAGVMAAVAGAKLEAVVETFVYGVFVVPVVVAAGMVGLWLTEPLARQGAEGGLFDHSPWPDGYRLVMATALGLGTFSLAILALGTVHLVEPAAWGGAGLWVLMVVPAGGALAGWRATGRFRAGRVRGVLGARAHRGEWLLILAAVPVAVLLIAATFPPGSLWNTEARGYDVMEYHLELPREYALNNSTAPLGHNVYSYLPANVEMLYLLVMQFAKGIMEWGTGVDRDTGYIWGTFPAQFLHAFMMLLTACALALMPIGLGGRPRDDARAAPPSVEDESGSARTASCAAGARDVGWLGATGRAVAVLLFLGVPWTLVTGSLAYNEAGMMLFGTLALGVALDGGGTSRQRGRGVLLGVLLGLAMGCKMTAGVFFALPVAVIYLMRSVTDGTQLLTLLRIVLVAGAAYLPWAVRAAAYSGGNPVFPLATSILPRDGWTGEQTARFDRGHAAPEALRSPGARLWALGENSLLDGQWSVQPYPVMYALLHDKADPGPDLGDGWKRLGLLWLAVPLALAGALITGVRRAEAGMVLTVLGVQVMAWLVWTHLQGRFLLPAAVPLAILAGRGVQGLHTAREAIPIAALRIITGTLVALHALATALILSAETMLLGGFLLPRHQAPPEMPIGDAFRQVINLAAYVDPGANPSVPVPPRKVFLVADGRAWMFIGEVDYCTVFDRSPFYETLGDPQKAMAWLRSHQVRYVAVNWSLWQRMRDTYGFDPAVTPQSMAALRTVGAEEVHTPFEPNLMVLRVPE